MKTRTASFDAEWNQRRARSGAFKVSYKRRYWNGAAYVWESSETIIPNNQIDNILGLNWKFDIPLQDEILPSNITVTIKNKGYLWLPSNTEDGIFSADAIATSGYEYYKTQFFIYYGYKLASGTIEYLQIFTGYIFDDPKFDSKSGLATIILMGVPELKLQDLDAQTICTTLTDQVTTPANGDGVTLAFDTLQKSVWRVTQVKDNSVVQSQATKYTLSQINDPGKDALINFLVAPINLHPILWSGSQWYRNKKVSELVGLICDGAGISAGDREIEEPLWPSAAATKKIPTDSAFTAGLVLTSVDSLSQALKLLGPWVLFDTFSDSVYTGRTAPNMPTWSIIDTNGGWSIDVTANKLRLDVSYNGAGGPIAQIQAPFTVATGTYRFRLSCDYNTASPASGDGVTVLFLTTGGMLAADKVRGYGIRFNTKAASTNPAIELVRFDNEVTNAGTVLAILQDHISALASDVWTITRDGSGNMTVYKNGVSVGTATDNTYATNAYFALSGWIGGGDGCLVSIDQIYYSTLFAAGNAEFDSAELDLLAAPTAWGPIDALEDLNGGTIEYALNVSAVSGAGYDGWIVCANGATPTNNLKRYAKLRVRFPFDPTVLTISDVTLLTLNYFTTDLYIQSADFTGMTGYDAIKELAKDGGMEFGSKGSGVFFFRNKPASSISILELSQNTVVLAALDYRSGDSDVRNIGRVPYGTSNPDGSSAYYTEYKDTDAGEAAPSTRTRLGDRPISRDLSKFTFANDVSIAAAVAQIAYQTFYRPKRKLRLECRLIPHLDLSDTVRVNIQDSPLIAEIIFGDPFQTGFPGIGPSGSKPLNVLARDIIMKVIGHQMDLIKSAKSVLDLEEVL